MEPEEDLRSPLKAHRVGRAMALMAVSLLAIGIATITYAYPQLSHGPARQSPAASAHAGAASYQLAAIDFVNPSTGWVVVELSNHDFAVLHTADAGRTWERQLTGPGGDIGEYARFFDSRDGVLVMLGPQAVMFQTRDAGKTWSRDDLQFGGGHVVFADFVDARHEWLLVQVAPDPSAPAAQVLYRTSDGGVTWVDLGDPVAPQDAAFRIVFADPFRGWLYSVSGGPYAYTTADGGASWRRVPLPAPSGAWPTASSGSPSPEEFFVAASPTTGAGVVATVIPIAPPNRRSADGETLLGYPPFTVRAFDGGGAVTYVYTTFGDSRPYRYTGVLSGAGQVIAPIATGQVELSSLDGGSSWKAAAVPSGYGAFGFADALDWWWVGAGTSATSSDGGITWTSTRPLGVPAPLPGSLQILDADHAWFGTMVGPTPFLQTTSDGGHEWQTVRLPAPTP